MAGKSIRQRVSDIEARVGASNQRSFGEELVSDRAIFDRLTVDAANGLAQQANNSADRLRNFGSRTVSTSARGGVPEADRVLGQEELDQASRQTVNDLSERGHVSVEQRTARAERQQQTQQLQQEQQQAEAARE